MHKWSDSRALRVGLLWLVFAIAGYLVTAHSSIAVGAIALFGAAAIGLAVEPRYVLLALAILVPFRGLDSAVAGVLPGNILVSDVALAVFAASALLRRERPGKNRLPGVPIVLGVLLLLLLVASTAHSAYVADGLRKTGRVLVIALAVLGASRTLDAEDVFSAGVALVVSFVTASLLGASYMLRAVLVAPSALEPSSFVRLWGGAVDPNYFAVTLGMALPIALTWPVRRHRRLWAGLLITLVGAEILTLSRGGLVGALVGIGVCGVLASWLRQRGNPVPFMRPMVGVLAVMCLVAAAVFVVSPATIAFVTYRFGGLANPETDPTGIIRLRIQGEGLRILAGNRLLGIGPGAFSEAIAASGTFTHGWVAHNSLLEVLVETGYVGASALVGLLLWGLWAAIRSLRRLVGSTLHRGRVVQMMAGLIAAYVAGIAGSLFLSNVLYEPAFALVAIMLVGAVCGSYESSTEELAHVPGS